MKMTKKPDINILSEQIYEANKSKGFHEEEHSENHLLCLVASELMEAVEADRKGRKAQMQHFEECIASISEKDFNEQYPKIFDTYIKNTVEDEMADAVIRLLDMAGTRKYTLTKFPFIPHISKEKPFTENIWAILKELVCLQSVERVYCVLLEIELLCRNLSIDLWFHVKLKLRYNSLRPYKHGKLY